MCYSRCLSLALVSLLLLAAVILPRTARAQQPNYVENQIVVRFADDATSSEIASLRQNLKANVVYEFKTLATEQFSEVGFETYS
jgi:hypothetical protein